MWNAARLARYLEEIDPRMAALDDEYSTAPVSAEDVIRDEFGAEDPDDLYDGTMSAFDDTAEHADWASVESDGSIMQSEGFSSPDGPDLPRAEMPPPRYLHWRYAVGLEEETMEDPELARKHPLAGARLLPMGANVQWHLVRISIAFISCTRLACGIRRCILPCRLSSLGASNAVSLRKRGCRAIRTGDCPCKRATSPFTALSELVLLPLVEGQRVLPR